MSRILIAEDEPRLSSFLEKGLRAAGHATTVCDDGVKCAAMARDEEFDLMILDIGMPGQDGFAVLRDMRGRGERMPVLVLTARDEIADTERIFERFARAGGARRRSEGAGLGLSIVRAIAEAHGGRVELDTRPGAGATFTLMIPLRPIAASPQSPAPQAGAPA